MLRIRNGRSAQKGTVAATKKCTAAAAAVAAIDTGAPATTINQDHLSYVFATIYLSSV